MSTKPENKPKPPEYWGELIDTTAAQVVSQIIDARYKIKNKEKLFVLLGGEPFSAPHILMRREVLSKLNSQGFKVGYAWQKNHNFGECNLERHAYRFFDMEKKSKIVLDAKSMLFKPIEISSEAGIDRVAAIKNLAQKSFNAANFYLGDAGRDHAPYSNRLLLGFLMDRKIPFIFNDAAEYEELKKRDFENEPFEPISPDQSIKSMIQYSMSPYYVAKYIDYNDALNKIFLTPYRRPDGKTPKTSIQGYRHRVTFAVATAIEHAKASNTDIYIQSCDNGMIYGEKNRGTLCLYSSSLKGIFDEHAARTLAIPLFNECFMRRNIPAQKPYKRQRTVSHTDIKMESDEHSRFYYDENKRIRHLERLEELEFLTSVAEFLPKLNLTKEFLSKKDGYKKENNRLFDENIYAAFDKNTDIPLDY
ncbi:MAG: hypothetical protein KDJ35_08695 [Alphaproteobacteria bacterium]|nr:hypothetical protein [Alphaproteobacteria bacterium]